MNLDSKTYFIILIIAIISVSVTQAIFKIVADEHKNYLLNVIYDYRLYIAIFIYTIAFILWIVALSRVEFSIAIPLNMITIISGGILGYFLFGEHISGIKIASYILISIGLLMLTYDALKA